MKKLENIKGYWCHFIRAAIGYRAIVQRYFSMHHFGPIIIALFDSQPILFFSPAWKKIRELKKTRKHRRVWMTFYSCCGHRTSVKLILFYRPLWSYNNWALWRITNFIFILFFGVSIVILKLKMNGHRHVSCCVPYKRQWRKFRSR